MTSAERIGRATHEDLAELHRLLIVTLQDRMRPAKGKRKPGQELLGVVGQVLRQEGLKSFMVSDRRVKQMQELHRLYIEALLDHMASGKASSGVLQEVGAALRAAGVTKDLGHAETVQRLQQLTDLALPFKH